MNPIDVANELRNRYISYLTTTFGLNAGMRQLCDRFVQLLSQPGQLLAGPFLEATAPYMPGDLTLEGLVTSGLVQSGFQQLFERPEGQTKGTTQGKRRGFGLGKSGGSSESSNLVQRRRERFPADLLLYRHQQQAIDRLCREIDQHELERNTVVASGTGSGKTECFLIPAIDWILRHPTRSANGNEIGQGIRVLLVYPMNALVNDQIRRLTQLVGCWDSRGDKPIPVTFARYTSETRKTRKEGEKHEPNAPDNQLLGRDEIIENPPDLLITNFAMLEQALLRPQESPFFSQVDEFAWRFLILDEAHSYRGAQGIELARLMQRVRAAVRRGKQAAAVPVREPVCVATSATLAGQNMTLEQRHEKTAEFSSALFGGVPFGDDSVIFADRLDPAEGVEQWSFPDADAAIAADNAWAGITAEVFRDLDQPGDDAFWNQFRKLALPDVFDQSKLSAPDDRRAFLYYLLRGHPRFHWLWEQVNEAPQIFEQLVERWSCDPGEDYSTHLETLVSACNAARRCPGEQPLLPCRYHLFASALEGLFVDLERVQKAVSNQSFDHQVDESDLHEGVIALGSSFVGFGKAA